jgi:Tol biopolymer transport system component
VKKRSTYLDLGRRQAFGRPIKKILPPLPPAPDPSTVADFDLGSWRVRPSLSHMTRADRIQALDPQTLSILIILGQPPIEPVNREELATRVFGRGGIDQHGEKFRASLSFLRRVLSEDGSVRIVNALGDCYQLEIGDPVADRGLRANDSEVLMLMPKGISHWLNRARHRLRAISIAGAIVATLIVGLVVLIGKSTRVTFDPFVNNTPFITDPGQNLSPQFSPNGQQVVYSHRAADGTEKLWIKALNGGIAHPLTEGAGQDAFPAWSRTGNLIAFQRRSKTDCQVLVISSAGGEARHLGDCEFGADGPMTWVAEDKALIVTHRTAWALPTQIISFTQADGKMTGVTNPASGMPGDRAPNLTADGRRLAFVRSKAPGVADLTLLEQDGTQAKTVTRDALPIHGNAWEPAGISMIISSARGGRDALWRSRLDGGRLELAVSLKDALRAPTVSPDGRTLIYERWRITSRFVQHTLNDDDQGHAVTIASGHALERGAHLSEDGKRWVFVSSRSGQDQLWIGDSSGATPIQLTHSDADYLETPRWSRDGKSVVFTASHHGQMDVWSVDVANGHLEALTRDGKSKAPSFSRDGHSLYVGSARNGHWQIWRQPWPTNAKNHAEQITQTGGLAAIESADGSLLYYVRHDRKGLWQRSRNPGGDESLLSAELAPLDWRNWDVASDAIWFVARREDSDPMLAKYSFFEGRLLRGPTLPKLLPESGLTLTPDRSSVWLSEIVSTQVDLEKATLSHQTQ